ncbi:MULTISPECIES: phosphoribosylanthranilate isomerase [Deefgea]|uniref:N-(5'-phosphoribosyl)anthranilate isomerase n=1 Tax=Deefgea chitinilytica TaxID=570276 RepID=A0ABS2CAH7_9NEIS|nr:MULTISPECIES: phosphoribosylanthranilate isomerase [Deefgea]MBM5570381.1 phosphoribosylanthranilate isomerase [Deefgea chitinilytica]MBM9887610.1 phosphoribosylanthranilate isomerase [Deefgea sp. CFH1-16]
MNQHLRTRVKVCGLRDAQTARAVAQAGADAIGLVFYPPSPRHVSIEQATEIVASLPAFVMSVGLFVNESALVVSSVLEKVPLDLLQFHGDEDLAYCSQFGRPFIKAVRVKPDLNLLEYAQQFVSPLCRGLLLDAWVDGVPGGTGHSFDWNGLPSEWPLPLILSGGLHAGNIAQAIKQVRPWAVDVSSGVEVSKGVKDLQRVDAFIRAVI